MPSTTSSAGFFSAAGSVSQDAKDSMLIAANPRIKFFFIRLGFSEFWDF